MKATTIHIDEVMLGRIDSLANTLSRSRSWVINQAIGRYIEYEEWFVQQVKNAMEEVEQGEIASDQEVAERFRKWGADAR